MPDKKQRGKGEDLRQAMALSLMPGFSLGMQRDFPAQIRLASRERQPQPQVPLKGKRKGK
jgi:hypothetical protein